jgi:XTP/dITP diphosphohydrolase
VKELVFATHNAHKLAEIGQMVGSAFRLVSLSDIGCNEDIEESGLTFHANASIKSRFVYDHYGRSCFADDSGLEVTALGNEPGVRSARYAGGQKNDSDNMSLLLDRMKGFGDRRARFVTVISLLLDGTEYFFEGELNGVITTVSRGSKGFGYDPVFVPEGMDTTLAEIDATHKNRISHRARAFSKLAAFLQERKS